MRYFTHLVFLSATHLLVRPLSWWNWQGHTGPLVQNGWRGDAIQAASTACFQESAARCRTRFSFSPEPPASAHQIRSGTVPHAVFAVVTVLKEKDCDTVIKKLIKLLTSEKNP